MRKWEECDLWSQMDVSSSPGMSLPGGKSPKYRFLLPNTKRKIPFREALERTHRQNTERWVWNTIGSFYLDWKESKVGPGTGPAAGPADQAGT